MRFIRPDFWNADHESTGPYKNLFDYQRIWRLSFAVLVVVSIVPLVVMAFVDFNVTRGSVESDSLLRTERLTSNARRSIAYFLNERESALKFIVKENSFQGLLESGRLEKILASLKDSFGGFVDIGVIDKDGKQLAYVGPYELEGKEYKGQAWFRQTEKKGTYISGAFLGFRDVPHFFIAVKCSGEDGCFYILRATLDTSQFNGILASMDISGGGDAFLADTKGIIQTPSSWNGNIFEKVRFPLPEQSYNTKVSQIKYKGKDQALVGYAYIEGTPFVLLVVKPLSMLMASWEKTRDTILWATFMSAALIVVVIWIVSSYMVERIYIADLTRSKTLQKMEHHNRMASIGRLAAGVAHEINNPLAIINEKAGLLKDLFTFSKEYEADDKLIGLIDSVLRSVERCGKITKRLLGFARQTDFKIEPLEPGEVIDIVLSFLNKEAQYRSININVTVADGVSSIETDKGKLEQILLNLISNAFQAMRDGGNLQIGVAPENEDEVVFSVSDDGCGIPEADLKRIFEPFFSTKKNTGGTGLGLSITYGLVRDLGGRMNVDSEMGRGTTFRFALPVKHPELGKD
jgi:signal transduction histidine kinase